MNDKTLSLLGLSRRANKLEYGNDTVIKSIKERKAELVILTQDISQNTEKNIIRVAQEFDVKLIKTSYTMDDMDYAIGKRAGIFCVNDKGFSDKLISLLETEKH